jgi:transposase-like protein
MPQDVLGTKTACRIITDPKKAAFALQLLLEGTSIRATARLTGLMKDTVRRIMEQAGRHCFQFLADTMQNIRASDIQ